MLMPTSAAFMEPGGRREAIYMAWMDTSLFFSVASISSN
jgi:hypothetical protein